MIISRRPDHLQLITHPDHGVIAGELAANWGNERFAPPAPRDALLIAATHHDDGWLELDGRPTWNETERRPAHFLELPLSETYGPYGRGVDSVYERSPLAGVLVSMHWSGFYTKRWGIQPGNPVTDPLALRIVTEQEQRWVGAVREAWNYDGPRSAFDAEVWHAYGVLQALDFISLGLCLLDVGRAAANGEALVMPATLRALDQAASARIVPNVPENSRGRFENITLWVDEPGRVVLNPYPFASEEFEVQLPTRALEDRKFGSADEAAAAFHAAPIRSIAVVVAPGRAVAVF